MANKYVIKTTNEPNPNILAESYVNLYITQILKSSNPEAMYLDLLDTLDKEIKLEEKIYL